MATCFMIQPFDNDKYDNRFDEIYAPAIRDANLEPYRVDRDHSVAIPITDIETGIRNAAVCLVDISEDNPNVWFEFGFAISLRKEILIVCDVARRDKFPFDIQHRRVVRYRTASLSDFTKLRDAICSGLKFAFERSQSAQSLQDAVIEPSAGLDEYEVAMCAAIATSADPVTNSLSLYLTRQAMERMGYTGMAIQLASRKLIQKGFLRTIEDRDYDGDSFTALELQESAWTWLISNQSKFVMKTGKRKDLPTPAALDEDIPF